MYQYDKADEWKPQRRPCRLRVVDHREPTVSDGEECRQSVDQVPPKPRGRPPKRKDHMLTVEFTTERLIQSARNKLLLEAGYWLYCLSYASEYETCGGRFPPGTVFDSWVPHPPEAQLLPIMQEYARRVEAVWVHSIEETFVRMELMPHEWPSALYQMLAACMGHGIGMEDDYDANLDNYTKEEDHVLNTTPISIDSMQLDDLAHRQILASGEFPRVVCGLCNQPVVAAQAQTWRGVWIGGECGCWNERLRDSE